MLADMMTAIKEEVVGAVTTDGNPSVAYLPGGFGNIRNMLMSLNPIKKQWGLEVLENDLDYTVKVEDVLEIKVNKKDYEEFNTCVYNVCNGGPLDLVKLITEAKTEEVHLAYNNISRTLLTDLPNNEVMRQAFILYGFWTRLFPKGKPLHMQQTLLTFENYKADIVKLMGRLKNIYSDDLGGLQMLLQAIEDGRPLNSSDPFSEYEYLIGSRIETEYNGIVMRFEITINMSMMLTSSLYIESKEVLQELEAYRTVKVANNVVFPMGMTFKPAFFTSLKDVIDNLEEA